MRIIIVHPGEAPEAKDIEPTLENFQSIVGGHFEACYPFKEQAILVCNEEGKYREDFGWNRALYHPETGEIMDIVRGPFFICGLGEEDFTGLTPELEETLMKRFEKPEEFVMTARGIKVIR